MSVASHLILFNFLKFIGKNRKKTNKSIFLQNEKSKAMQLTLLNVEKIKKIEYEL